MKLSFKKIAARTGLMTCALLLAGCAPPKRYTPNTLLEVTNSQNAENYLSLPPSFRVIPKERQQQMANLYLEHWFRPWAAINNNIPLNRNIAAIKKQERNILIQYETSPSYGANFHRNSKHWIATLASQMQLNEYPNLIKRAILVHGALVRLLPTNRPAFSAYGATAGQGYPFDNFQVSALWAGTPILTLQQSKNHKWILIKSPLVYGWVQSQDIAYVTPDFIQQFETGHYAVLKQDELPLLNRDGFFEEMGRIGGLYPVKAQTNTTVQVAMPLANLNHMAILELASLNRAQTFRFPASFTVAHMTLMINHLVGSSYGWGGSYFFRDCSATLHDLFSTFGIWLPRNSLAQSYSGTIVNLGNLTNEQKLTTIQKYGQPYLSLLHLPGHIMLYLGKSHGELYMFHNMWGLATFQPEGEGRAVVGKAVITPVTFGHQQLLSLMDRLTIL